MPGQRTANLSGSPHDELLESSVFGLEEDVKALRCIAHRIIWQPEEMARLRR